MIVTFDSPDEAQVALKADEVCKQIGQILIKHYPKRRWFVEVSIKGGVAQIQCPSISMQYGYTLHLNKTHDQMVADVIKAGGQILEMFALSRERGAKGGEELLARDSRGEVIQAATGL
ncbi:hypothetical protein [uncultured Halomonas sp.]|uniref:hypothetical protein n=1 Tax=uncultured Halomonas sp. TaxID=173971 RepID=UPI00262138E2|nr:hypothetical protein [uncultured Halomonas sp.]